MATIKVHNGSVWTMPALKVYNGSTWEPVVAYMARLKPELDVINATYGDEMESIPLSGSWTKRNIAQAETLTAATTWKSAAVNVVFDAQGDTLYRTAPAGDYEIVAAISISGDLGGMSGICMLDGSGNGGSYGLYNDGRIYSWNISAYNYSSTGTSNGDIPGPGLFFLSMRKVGGNATCKHSSNGIDWSGTVSVGVGASVFGFNRPFTGSSTTMTIHRINLYTGPNFYVP